MMNLKYVKQLKNGMGFIAAICKKLRDVSKFNFTLLGNTDVFCYKKSKSSWKFLTALVTFFAYLIGSITERSKIYILLIYLS